METRKKTNEKALTGKNEILLAIAAATAANCIPCFEHLYEMAVSTGITADEIRRTSEIAGLVKRGAHAAISGTIDELTGLPQDCGPSAVRASSGCGCR
jgi:alkylhydroperoxidase/carboxymuconolactone decarboxylase family protein YurZ